MNEVCKIREALGEKENCIASSHYIISFKEKMMLKMECIMNPDCNLK